MSNSSPQLIDLIVPTADEHDAFVRIRNRSKDAVLNLAADFHHCLTVSKTEDRLRFLCGHYKVSVQTVKRLVNLHNIHVAHGDTFAKIVTSMPFLVTAWEASGAETTYAHYAHMAAAYLTLNKMGDEVVWPKRANGSLIMSGTTMKKLASTNLPGKKAPLPLVCPIAKKKKTAWKLADWTSGVAAVAGRVQKIRKARADNEQEDGMAQDDGEQDHEAMKEAATLELAQWRQSVEADRAILVAAKAKQDEVIAAQQAALAEQEAALAEQARTIERQRAAAAAAQAKNRRARDDEAKMEDENKVSSGRAKFLMAVACSDSDTEADEAPRRQKGEKRKHNDGDEEDTDGELWADDDNQEAAAAAAPSRAPLAARRRRQPQPIVSIDEAVSIEEADESGNKAASSSGKAEAQEDEEQDQASAASSSGRAAKRQKAAAAEEPEESQGQMSDADGDVPVDATCFGMFGKGLAAHVRKMQRIPRTLSSEATISAAVVKELGVEPQNATTMKAAALATHCVQEYTDDDRYDGVWLKYKTLNASAKKSLKSLVVSGRMHSGGMLAMSADSQNGKEWYETAADLAACVGDATLDHNFSAAVVRAIHPTEGGGAFVLMQTYYDQDGNANL